MASGLTPAIHEGSIDRLLGSVVIDRGLREVLLVTDPGVTAAGHSARARRSLEAAGVSVRVYDKVQSNPTNRDAQACAAAAQGVDGFVAVGGGSCIDTAKGGSFIVTNGGSMADYQGFGHAKEPLLPIVAVPTTAGTGSEVQSYTLISDDETHTKMACGAMGAMPVATVLDAELTVTMSRQQTAYTGLDAIVHAVESAVCNTRTDASTALAFEAFALLATHLLVVLENPQNLEARTRMLRGSMLAGRAIEASMLGAAHASANPLTARFGVPHGVAVATMLPHVIRFNSDDPNVAKIYTDLAAQVGRDTLDKQIEILMDHAQIESLETFGVQSDTIDELAKEASLQWTGQFNPRPVDTTAFAVLYRQVLSR